jgi:SAM-dependent methyltransferase/uncharacterized protein YbaR (Trm112 family)
VSIPWSAEFPQTQRIARLFSPGTSSSISFGNHVYCVRGAAYDWLAFVHSWLISNLRCPRDHGPFVQSGRELICQSGHHFPIIDGIPVMLLPEKPDTGPFFAETLERAKDDPPYEDARKSNPLAPGEIDHICQRQVSGSCGHMYVPLINKLTRYPIPRLRLKPSNGGRLLDIGCAWGRWSLAAASIGYRAVGIDPSIHKVLAARRIATQLGYTENVYLVADGRYLPFDDACFEAAFSYSCLQHMSEGDVRLILREIQRTLKPAGLSLIEMPNKWGLRNLYSQMRRGFRQATYTDVRYWTPKDLLSTFNECIGPSTIEVDGFFTINPQISDIDLLPLRYKLVVLASEALRRMSGFIRGLRQFADSLYVVSRPNRARI